MDRPACAAIGLTLALCFSPNAYGQRGVQQHNKYKSEVRLWAMATALEELCPSVGYYVRPLPSQEQISNRLYYLAPDFLGYEDPIDTLPDHQLEEQVFTNRLKLAMRATQTKAELNALITRQCEVLYQDTGWSYVFTRNFISP